MGLINHDPSVLKSLKFGKDKPGGGSSKQPYIQTQIPDDDKLAIADKDFLWRGGLKAPIHAAKDLVRLSKYMSDIKSPSGLLFTVKQNILSRTAVKTEASTGLGYGGGAFNEGIYTPLSTLTQAGVGFTGTHLNKQGIDPTSPMTGVLSRGLFGKLGLNRYEDIVRDKDSKKESQLIRIFNSFETSQFVKTYSGGPGSVLGIGQTKIKFADQRTGYNNINARLTSFFTGKGNKKYPEEIKYSLKPKQQPGGKKLNIDFTSESMFGFKSSFLDVTPNYTISNLHTPVKVIKNTTTEKDSTYKSPIQTKLKENKRELISPLKFIEGNTWRATTLSKGGITTIPEYNSSNSINVIGGYLPNRNKQAGWVIANGEYKWANNPSSNLIGKDFREDTRTIRGFASSHSNPEYERLADRKWKEAQENQPLTPRTDPLGGDISTNFYYISDSSSFKTSRPFIRGNDNDLVHFGFTILNPQDLTENRIRFRAYIDSFSDSYGSDWKEQKYMGRAEAFHKYESFGRDISLSFTVVAESSKQLETMYIQLNALAASLAPTYTTQGYMAGNIHHLQMGHYINEYGILKGFTYDVKEETPWDISKEKPMYIHVTGVKFVPIHGIRPSIESIFIK